MPEQIVNPIDELQNFANRVENAAVRFKKKTKERPEFVLVGKQLFSSLNFFNCVINGVQLHSVLTTVGQLELKSDKSLGDESIKIQ